MVHNTHLKGKKLMTQLMLGQNTHNYFVLHFIEIPRPYFLYMRTVFLLMPLVMTNDTLIFPNFIIVITFDSEHNLALDTISNLILSFLYRSVLIR